MASRLRWWTWVLVLLVLAEGAALGALLLRSQWQRNAEGTPVQRGRRVAERMGCFGCHGPSGAAGIPNPGTDGTVPAWSDGTWMMYNDSEADVRAWIADGKAPGTAIDPKALLRMPAYKSRLAAGGLDDLTAYVLTEMQFGDPADARTRALLAAARGRFLPNRVLADGGDLPLLAAELVEILTIGPGLFLMAEMEVAGTGNDALQPAEQHVLEVARIDREHLDPVCIGLAGPAQRVFRARGRGLPPHVDAIGGDPHRRARDHAGLKHPANQPQAAGYAGPAADR